MRPALIALAVLLASPTAFAQSPQIGFVPAESDTPTTLYFHLINVRDFPINTQVPAVEWTEDVGYGAGTTTATCIAPAVGNTLGAENEYQTYHGFSTPSYVNYEAADGPLFHPVRGYGANITVAPGAVLHWYLVGDAPVASVPGLATAHAAPNVLVRATLRSGDAISPDDKAYDSGEILAQAEAGPFTLLAGQARPAAGAQGSVTVTRAGDQAVYDVAVPLGGGLTLNKETGFNLRIDVYIDNPACADPGAEGYLMAQTLMPFADATHQPRIDLRASPPMAVVHELMANRTAQGLELEWWTRSAWGAYDANVANETVSIAGPEGAEAQRIRLVQRIHEHYHMNEPVRSTWLWNWTGGQPAAGTYVVEARMPNLQGTDVATSTLHVHIGPDGSVTVLDGTERPTQELPASGLPLLALVAVAAALLARRR